MNRAKTLWSRTKRPGVLQPVFRGILSFFMNRRRNGCGGVSITMHYKEGMKGEVVFDQRK